jgi:hypothetical protein
VCKTLDSIPSTVGEKMGHVPQTMSWSVPTEVGAGRGELKSDVYMAAMTMMHLDDAMR